MPGALSSITSRILLSPTATTGGGGARTLNNKKFSQELQGMLVKRHCGRKIVGTGHQISSILDVQQLKNQFLIQVVTTTQHIKVPHNVKRVRLLVTDNKAAVNLKIYDADSSKLIEERIYYEIADRFVTREVKNNMMLYQWLTDCPFAQKPNEYTLTIRAIRPNLVLKGWPKGSRGHKYLGNVEEGMKVRVTPFEETEEIGGKPRTLKKVKFTVVETGRSYVSQVRDGKLMDAEDWRYEFVLVKPGKDLRATSKKFPNTVFIITERLKGIRVKLDRETKQVADILLNQQKRRQKYKVAQTKIKQGKTTYYLVGYGIELWQLEGISHNFENISTVHMKKPSKPELGATIFGYVLNFTKAVSEQLIHHLNDGNELTVDAKIENTNITRVVIKASGKRIMTLNFIAFRDFNGNVILSYFHDQLYEIESPTGGYIVEGKRTFHARGKHGLTWDSKTLTTGLTFNGSIYVTLVADKDKKIIRADLWETLVRDPYIIRVDEKGTVNISVKQALIRDKEMVKAPNYINIDREIREAYYWKPKIDLKKARSMAWSIAREFARVESLIEKSRSEKGLDSAKEALAKLKTRIYTLDPGAMALLSKNGETKLHLILSHIKITLIRELEDRIAEREFALEQRKEDVPLDEDFYFARD